jgi:hypothetical protein
VVKQRVREQRLIELCAACCARGLRTLEPDQNCVALFHARCQRMQAGLQPAEPAICCLPAPEHATFLSGQLLMTLTLAESATHNTRIRSRRNHYSCSTQRKWKGSHVTAKYQVLSPRTVDTRNSSGASQEMSSAAWSVGAPPELPLLLM